MKRFRISRFLIDGTRQTLTQEGVPPEHKDRELERIKERYGSNSIEEKLERYIEITPPNFMVVPDYLNILHEIRDAYIFGHYYPSLTSACCLGERILNILIIKMRGHFKKHRRYNWSKRHNSFTDWKPCIDLLLDWNGLTEETAKEFRKLEQIRHDSVHFDNLQDLETRSLTAVNLIFKITDDLFGVNQRNFFWTPGVPYVRKDREKDPMVIEFILPHCVLVSYKNYVEIDSQTGKLTIYDNIPVLDKELTDEEFADLVKNFREQGGPYKTESNGE